MNILNRLASLLLASLLAFGLAGPAMARPGPAPHADKEPRIALVVGNTNYSAEMKLANPAKDAALIGGTLQKLGFDVILLTDATQKQMQRAIVAFGDRLAKAGPDAVGLFYYAGHGLQVEGQNFLVPIDADISREVDVEIDAVSADLVLKQMAYAESRVNIVILDACRNNPLARDFRSVSTSQGFAEIRIKPKGTFISYSTAPGEVAVDGKGDHSPFAEALAVAMQDPGLDLPEVFQHVREKVLAATEERQTPWDSSSLVKSFYFIPPADHGEALVAAAAPTPTAPVAAPEPAAAATAATPAATPVQLASADDSFVATTRSLFARSGARLREAPSTEASVVAKLPANAKVLAVARSADGKWWQVETRDTGTAFVAAQAVSDFRTATSAPQVSAVRVTTPQPAAAPRSQASAVTGIGVVDKALGWFASASSTGASQPGPTRASR